MADISKAFELVCEKFGISELNGYQREAIVQIVEKKTDVFINLPTGFGKSLIYQALPLVFDTILGAAGHIVIVVSPLVNLMKDQVGKLINIGIPAVTLSDIDEESIKRVEKGSFSVVYGSPEAWLKNDRWRKTLSSDIYRTKLCAIAVDEAHVIKQWGTSSTSNMAAFRETFAELHELRSLAPSVNMLALTATATSSTREIITEILLMKDPHVIYESPSKNNIAYSVLYMEKDREIEQYFQWLVEEIQEKKVKTTRTIIYCQTIKQCGIIYATIKVMLGSNMYSDNSSDPRKVVLEMLHSCTPDSNKEAVLDAFQNEDSPVRVLVATIAFGMGIDCKGVHRTIHFGPSKNIEAYIQETGRAGRDGKQSVAFIIYQGLFLNHVDKDMKSYVKTSDCRRKILLHNFDGRSTSSFPHPMHMCCDNCAAECKCGALDCGHLTRFPVFIDEGKEDPPVRKRQGTTQQRDTLCEKLHHYHKSLVMDLINKSESGQLKTLTNPQFLLGFSELQIAQVMDNANKMFTVNDICSYVEIWNLKHAYKILEILSQVYGDVLEIEEYLYDDDQIQYGFDYECDDLNEQWDDFLNDDSLFELAIENISLSQLEASSCTADVSCGSLDKSMNLYVPGAALDALENCSFAE